jgi:PAS domain S-box-containing protein
MPARPTPHGISQREFERLAGEVESLRQSNEALRASEARMHRITESLPAQLAYVDTGWIYRYVNGRYAEWFGKAPGEIVDRPIEAIMPRAVFDQLAPHFRRALKGEEVSVEYGIAQADGEMAYAHSTLVPDVDADGLLAGCFVHETDISEQRRTHNALAQAQKMEAIGQLTGGLAHDFNNMLTVVLGNLAALREIRSADPQVGELVDPAMQAANHGAGLIRRLLTFARQQPLEPRPVDVNALVEGVARLIRRSLPANVALATASLAPDLLAVADAHQLESALVNLALNARDAMPNGGELRIEASLEALAGAAAADLELPPGEYIQIAVSDNGTGMDGSTLARVFEPFFTTKPFGRGSGLGLAMVYGFIKQSGGGVRIRSRQARGTTVALVLPRASAADTSHPPAPAHADDPLAAIRGQLVLLVDDDAQVRSVVRKQLAALECTVLEAENGSDAADLVENVAAIRLVLSDVVMPGGMDGRALARFVRRFRPELPVVLMSGFQATGADSAAADDNPPLLEKPFNGEALAAALAAIATRGAGRA